MGGTTAPVPASGSWPAWIARVENPASDQSWEPGRSEDVVTCTGYASAGPIAGTARTPPLFLLGRAGTRPGPSGVLALAERWVSHGGLAVRICTEVDHGHARARTAWTRRLRVLRPDDARRPRDPAARPVARGHAGDLPRAGLLLGRREGDVAASRGRHDGRRLPGWSHALPDVRRDVHRHDRARRDGPRRLRPDGAAHGRAAAHVLDAARPDAGLPAGQRRGHAVPLRDLHDDTRAGRGRDGDARALRPRARPQRLRPDHDRDPPRSGGRPVLLRRGAPPAVPAQGPERVLPGALDGCGLPGRVIPLRLRPGAYSLVA